MDFEKCLLQDRFPTQGHRIPKLVRIIPTMVSDCRRESPPLMVGVPTGGAFFNSLPYRPYGGYGKPPYVRLLPLCVFLRR